MEPLTAYRIIPSGKASSSPENNASSRLEPIDDGVSWNARDTGF
jgi:hypothetical protein